MDVHDKLDELTVTVEGARSMPLSASCVVNRSEVLVLLDEIRELLPAELEHATRVLSARDSVVEEGRAGAERVLTEARDEAARMVSENEVLRLAEAEAGRIVEDARTEAEQMRKETDDYVDGKLANFEIVLEKTLGTVHRGRERIQTRRPHEELGPLAQEFHSDTTDPVSQH